MSNVSVIVQKVLAGQAVLDVPTVHEIIEAAIDDKSINLQSELKPLKDRKFIQIDRDNFSDVMKRMTPGLNMRVENTLKGDGSEMAVQLNFNAIEDFDPANVAKQVEPLRKLLETRDKLRDLATKVDRSEDLEDVLEQVLQNSEELKKLSSELGADDSSGEGGE